MMSHAPNTLLKERVFHSQLDEAGRMPVSLFLPQCYEPRYPYPLLVFLHGHGEQETQWIDAVPELSRRNYICIGLRGLHPVVCRDGRTGYGWGRHRRCDSAIEDYVLTATREIMGSCHIHSERIFLAGICEGATIAYQLGLSLPQHFAGIIALNGWLPPAPLPLGQLRGEHAPRVFIGHGIANSTVSPNKAHAASSLLLAAGLQVQTRYYPSGHRLHPAMLRDVDRWLINHCRIK